MKRGILFLSLFLVSILFISGCGQMSQRGGLVQDVDPYQSYDNICSEWLDNEYGDFIETREWCDDCGSCPCYGDTGYGGYGLFCYEGDMDEVSDENGESYWDGGPNLGNAVYEGNCAPWYWWESDYPGCSNGNTGAACYCADDANGCPAHWTGNGPGEDPLLTKITRCLLDYDEPILCGNNYLEMDRTGDGYIRLDDAISVGVDVDHTAGFVATRDKYLEIRIDDVTDDDFDLLLNTDVDWFSGFQFYFTGANITGIGGGEAGGKGWKLACSNCRNAGCDHGDKICIGKINAEDQNDVAEAVITSTGGEDIHLATVSFNAKTDGINFSASGNNIAVIENTPYPVWELFGETSNIITCNTKLVGELDQYDGISGHCCDDCVNNPNLDDWQSPACTGVWAGDGGLIFNLQLNWGSSEAAGKLGCTLADLSEDPVDPLKCPAFYWADVNGNGHIDGMDASCSNAMASDNPCDEENGWCSGNCIVGGDGPCQGLHVGDECCIPIEE